MQHKDSWSVFWYKRLAAEREFPTQEQSFNPMKQHLKNSIWLHGNARQFLGPQVPALATLNLLAAFFSHSHSDASMRILHGYSSLGLAFGIYGSILLISIPEKSIAKLRSLPLLVANILCFCLNTWITIYGMDTPYGGQFHALLAILFTLNFYSANKISTYNKPVWMHSQNISKTSRRHD